MNRELKQAISVLLIVLMTLGPSSFLYGRGGRGGGGGGRGGGGGGGKDGRRWRSPGGRHVPSIAFDGPLAVHEPAAVDGVAAVVFTLTAFRRRFAA